MSLLIFIVRRVAFLVLTSFAVSLLIFGLTQILPGDVATMILGMSGTPEDFATLREQMGLDHSAVVQYWTWLSGILSGNLGISTRFNQPVLSLLLDHVVNSSKLATAGLAIGAPSGILLGIVAGMRPRGLVDRILSAVTLFAAAMPEFVTGAILILVMSTWLGWFPPFSTIEPGMTIGEQLHKLALPAISLNLVILAYTLRIMRSSMIDVLASAYVRAAILNGLPSRTVIFRHALPTALGPTLTVIALSIGWMAGGLIIVENMFGFPGIGRLLVFAIQNRDIPLIQAISLLIAVVYALSNLVADVLHRLLDPRTR